MATAALLGSLVTVGSAALSAASGGSGSVYRPSRWNDIQLTTITVPASSSQSQDNATGNIAVTSTAATVYVFDGNYRREHSMHAVKTRHPSQTGSAPTDHIFLEPQQLVLEIFMNDTMDSYAAGSWSGSSSKSVNAYQAIEKLWAARVPMQITTRLKSYQNMVITDVHTIDDSSTQFGLRSVVTFDELVFATVTTSAASARAQTTNSTSQGTLATTAPSSSLIDQHFLSPFPAVQGSNVPGAGTYSSNNIGDDGS